MFDKFDPNNPAYPDNIYKHLIKTCLEQGDEIETRNSKVKRIVAEKIEFKTTPLVTVRKCSWKNAIREWSWFMSGSDRICDLHPSIKSWWEPFAVDGRVKYNYSKQLRCQYGCDREGLAQELICCDQVDNFVRSIKDHPNSRRTILTTWNSAEMNEPDCTITNCHNTLTQAFVTNGRLKLVTYQRSADLIVGVPHNWIQESVFHLWLCAQTGLVVDSLVYIMGDIHIYEKHYELAHKILEQKSKPSPQLTYYYGHENFLADDFALDKEYRPSLIDKAEMVI
jgi:thymidylate synthase